MYKNYGVYRFLDKNKNTIYIGRSKNIYNRIYNQHFTPRGHLPKECYSSTYLVEIIKLDNNMECKALEDYLIEQYRPKYNIQDKSKSFRIASFGSFEKQLSKMEKWKTYRVLKDFDDKQIRKHKNSFMLSYAVCLLFFIAIIFNLISNNL